MLAAQLCQVTQTDPSRPPTIRFKRRKRLLLIVTPTLPTSSREPEDSFPMPLHVPLIPARSQPRTAMSLSRLSIIPTPEPRYHLPTPSLSHHSPSFAPSPLRHPIVSPARSRDLPSTNTHSPSYKAYFQAFRRLPGDHSARSHIRSLSRPKPLCPRERRLPALRLVSLKLPARSASPRRQPPRQESPGSLRSWDYEQD